MPATVPHLWLAAHITRKAGQTGRLRYGQLIREHEAIEVAAQALLFDLGDDDVTSDDLAEQLHSLADVVEAHIGVEDEIVAGFDSNQLKGPWAEAWSTGLIEFQRLRTDWIAFIDRWDAPAIADDRDGFCMSAKTILGRLRERVQIETKAFYATALQTGAIELR